MALSLHLKPQSSIERFFIPPKLRKDPKKSGFFRPAMLLIPFASIPYAIYISFKKIIAEAKRIFNPTPPPRPKIIELAIPKIHIATSNNSVEIDLY